jgi:hypothetical protein
VDVALSVQCNEIKGFSTKCMKTNAMKSNNDGMYEGTWKILHAVGKKQ